MDKILYWLSGGVPGGFGIWFAVVAALCFIWWFLHRYSPVVNHSGLARKMMIVLGLIVLTYTTIRFARPPKPFNVYVGILPLENQGSNKSLSVAGTGWGLAEITTHHAALGSPEHLHFLRPEWLVESYFGDSTSAISPSNKQKLFRWARLIKLNYLVAGFYNADANPVSMSYEVYDVLTGETMRSFTNTIPTGDEVPYGQAMRTAAEELMTYLYEVTDEEFNSAADHTDLFQTKSLPLYFSARDLLAHEQWDSAFAVARMALQKDSASVLGWFAAGSAYTEKMIREKEERAREMLQRRGEYHLKRGAQINDQYQPILMSLARNFSFTKPEPRYLDAEFAMIASQAIYKRDYQLYYILSFMQRMRWETFEMKSREEILNRAIEINPASFDAYVALGQDFLERSRPHDHLSQYALNNFNVALQLKPNDFESIMGMVRACDYLAYFDKAVELLERAEKFYPDRADVYYTYGVIYYHKGEYIREKTKLREGHEQFPIAEGYFKKAVQLNNSPYAWLYLGKIYDYQKRRNEAIEALRTVMKLLKPDDRYREEARKKLREYFPDVE